MHVFDLEWRLNTKQLPVVMADIIRQGFDLGRERGRVVVIRKPLLESSYNNLPSNCRSWLEFCLAITLVIAIITSSIITYFISRKMISVI